MLPNFLIVGAAKAGTTSLYYYLQQHPQISFPIIKEPKYFSSKNLMFPHNGIGDDYVDRYAIRCLSDYNELFFDVDNERVGEVSPDYLYYYKSCSKEIKELLGDIPIIIILRDPVKRAFSAYSYMVRDSRETLCFKDALTIEEKRLADNYDFIWGYKKGGLYYNQVSAYMNVFSKVKVVIFEDFIENIAKCMFEIFEFLGVKSDYNVETGLIYNSSGVPNNMFVKFLLSRNNKVSQNMREIAKKYIKREWLENISSKYLVKNKINKEDEVYLKKYYSDEIFKIETLLGCNLDKWKCC